MTHPFRTLLRLLSLLLAATALAGCSAMLAQNPSGTLKPVNAVPTMRSVRPSMPRCTRA